MIKGRSDDAGPDESVYSPSELVESVVLLLEEVGCPQLVSDRIAMIIEGWELSKFTQEEPE